MNWSSVKNLLIGILVAANLFLVYNITLQDRARDYINEDEVIGAIELLAERGLHVPDECVPREKFTAPVYESLYSDQYYTKTAEILSGSPREILLQTPNGGFSITAQNGAITEMDAEFGFSYIKNGNSEVSAYTVITAENFASESALWDAVSASKLAVLTNKAERFLERCVGDDYIISAEITDSYFDSESGFTYLLAKQLIGGYEVYSHYAVCVFSGEELVYSYGRWYFAPFDEDYNTKLIDQVNILFSDLSQLKAGALTGFDADGRMGAEPRENAEISRSLSYDTKLPDVKKIEEVYSVYWNAGKTALYFIPAWQIEHSDGQIIVYNATNGTVYAMKW